MQKDLTQLFRESALAAPEGLSEEIFIAVERAAERDARSKRYLWGSFSVVSLGLFVASGFYAAHSASATGFSSYFSLIFSDGSVVKSLWREVGLSLLESLPIIGFGVVLASVVAVLWSLRNFSKYTGRFIITSRATRAA